MFGALFPESPVRRRDRKLAAVRAAAAHRFPTTDIDSMLAEIDRGREGRGLSFV